MKTCPSCDQEIPQGSDYCPLCEDRTDNSRPIPEPFEVEKEEEPEGCLAILLIPLLTAFAATIILILAGFIINMAIHFESNQVKIAWIGISVFIGFLLYRLFSKKRKRSR
jgi:hypothetical protein